MKVKSLSDFLWKCFIAKLEVSYWYSYMISWPFLTPWKTRMHMNLDHVAGGHFVLGRGILCECADYWPLAIKYVSNKAMPAGKAAIPVRWKTCECCDHVFRSKQKVECNLQEKAMKHATTVVVWNQFLRDLLQLMKVTNWFNLGLELQIDSYHLQVLIQADQEEYKHKQERCFKSGSRSLHGKQYEGLALQCLSFATAPLLIQSSQK